MNAKETTTKLWETKAKNLLVGLKVVRVRYLTEEEADDIGFTFRPVVITFDNGLSIYPSSDDEGNDAGALFTTNEDTDVLPVLRDY